MQVCSYNAKKNSASSDVKRTDALTLSDILFSVGRWRVELNVSGLNAERNTWRLTASDRWLCVCASESRRPVKDSLLVVLSSHGDDGCVFGADGKPVWLWQIFRYFDNTYMEKKTKIFLIQVGSRASSSSPTHNVERSGLSR